MEKWFRKTFFVVCFGMTVALIVIIGAVLGSVISSSRDGEPDIFGFIPTIVITGSMEPNINIDSLNLYMKCDIEDIEVGDIAVFWSDEHQIDVIHRVIEITEVDGKRAVITQGDANEYPDNGYVTEDNLVGELTHTFNWSVPYVQKIMNYNRTEIDTLILTMYLLLGTIVLWAGLSCIYAMIVGCLMVFDQYHKHFKGKKIQR